MKPQWDQLMEKYADHAKILVADVDCTASQGKPLCEKHGVRGYPTIKYGDPDELLDYSGGRGLEDLQKFASSNLPVKPLSDMERALKKVNRLVEPLRLDVEHIMQFRKNAAVLLFVMGILLGVCAARCFCPRRVVVPVEKKQS